MKWTSYFTLEKGFCIDDEQRNSRPETGLVLRRGEHRLVGSGTGRSERKKGGPFSDVDGRFCAAGRN